MIEKVAPILIWVLFAFEAVRAGFVIPHWDMPGWTPDKSPPPALLAIPLFFFGLFTATGLWRPKPGSSILRRIGRRLHFEWLAVLFFGGGGAFAAVQCLRLESPPSNTYFALFMLSTGLGVLSGHVFFMLTRRGKTAA